MTNDAKHATVSRMKSDDIPTSEQEECKQDCPDCECQNSDTCPEQTPESEESTSDEPLTEAEELLKWRDMAMRTAAEYDNYRKRSVKDREEFTRYANRGLLEELLPIIDNFDMGMQMAQQETQSMIYIGMNMVQKQLADFLESQGVSIIATQVGDAFDHNIHEAIQSEASELPEGSIVRIIRRGYKLRDRLLRPVNVITAAAPSDEPAAE